MGRPDAGEAAGLGLDHGARTVTRSGSPLAVIEPDPGSYFSLRLRGCALFIGVSAALYSVHAPYYSIVNF